jgi:hypothetical protein
MILFEASFIEADPIPGTAVFTIRKLLATGNFLQGR